MAAVQMRAKKSAVEPPRRFDPGLWAISMKEPVNERRAAE